MNNIDKHWSRYNFLIKSENNKFLLYNSYTNNLIEIENENEYKILKQLEQGEQPDIEKDFSKELIDNYILVDDDDLLFQKVKLARLKARFASESLSITIAPTLACNFSCPYCFEGDTNGKKNISSKTINDIINFIQTFPNLNFLNVSWYGGEPLLAFNKIVEFTDLIKKIPIKGYSSSIVTNGYLLNEDKIKRLRDLNITNIQITIDGLEQTHNARRPHKTNDDSFKKIINNLINLYKLYPEVKTNIRVNIDKNNSEEFFLVNNYLKETIESDNLNIYPAYIFDYNSCKNSFCYLNKEEQANFALHNDDKYPFAEFYYPQTALSECCARYLNSYIIGPSGEFYKCWCDVGNQDRIVGNIQKGITNELLYFSYLTKEDPLLDTKCTKCSYYPICNGGCVLNRLKNTEGSNINMCLLQKNKLDKFLNLYYEKKCNKA